MATDLNIFHPIFIKTNSPLDFESLTNAEYVKLLKSCALIISEWWHLKRDEINSHSRNHNLWHSSLSTAQCSLLHHCFTDSEGHELFLLKCPTYKSKSRLMIRQWSFAHCSVIINLLSHSNPCRKAKSIMHENIFVI